MVIVMSPIRSIDRRHFLAITAATLSTLRSTGLAEAQAEATPSSTAARQALAPGASVPKARLKLHPEALGPLVPANFVGLSYETQQLKDPAFFSTANTGLIAQFKALAPHGVLRIGGNTSDVGWWKPTPASTQPPLPPSVFIVTPRSDEQPFQKLAYAITPEAVINLRAFLEATGWTCLYGINLGSSTPARAAEEAVFVAKTLDHKLEYFQLGNEPDLFQNRFRDKPKWTVDTYVDEWLASARAILAAVPTAKFGLPDASGNPQWYSHIADRLAALPDHSFVAAVSHHHYFGGPPSNPKVNIDALLQPQANVVTVAATTTAAAKELNTLYRMTEGNTCYRGGKPGVSDVFASALWAADYLLLLASLGYAGVNLHGGSGKAVADSLGGTLPGELLMPDPTAPHPRPFYTPIAEINGTYVAEPIYYGMKFASNFANATILKLDFDPGPVNATAFAAKMPNGQLAIAIINKDQSLDLPIDLAGYSLGLTLTAPSLTSTRVELSEPRKFREAGTIPHASAAILYQTRA